MVNVIIWLMFTSFYLTQSYHIKRNHCSITISVGNFDSNMAKTIFYMIVSMYSRPYRTDSYYISKNIFLTNYNYVLANIK